MACDEAPVRPLRILVFCDNYPVPGPGYKDAFVKTRLEAYRKALGAEIKVVKLARREGNGADYVLGGIAVEHHTRESLGPLLAGFAPDIVLAHFIQAFLCKALPELTDAPVLTWIHGEEALSWTSRLFYFRTLGPAELARYIVRNIRQLRAMAQLFRLANAHSERFGFVFVSDWMKRTAERDVGVRLETFSIIPNFVDTEHFRYEEKPPEARKRVLLIRSFSTAKYANDLAIRAIEELRDRYAGFDTLHFTIVGTGSLWDRLTRRIALPNVHLVNRMLDHDEIREMHKGHGVFLCPTRQDAQGVSMCEAMSSGLVPVTSHNTAIPEFVSPREGYLARSPAEMADAIIELAERPEVFARKSASAAAHVREKAGHDATIAREIALIRARRKPSVTEATAS